MKKMNGKLLVLFTAGMLSLTSCSDDDSNTTNDQGTSNMSVKMVDAPGDYDAVFVDVEGVVVKYNNDTEVALDVDSEIYNLLELTGGVNAQLALDDEIPAGTISQIRLVLGDDNTIVVDGETFDLATPSAQQSGLKLNINATLEDGYAYEYILDFDVEHSIVEQGNGGYTLTPVIRASASAETGIIEGMVILPSITPVLVTATSADGSIEVSSYTAADGSYAIYGLPEGNYTLTFTPALDLGLDIIVLNDIAVVTGEVEIVSDVNFQG